MIDIVSYFDNLGIDYKSGGKNVSANDVNICCPFCGEDRFHLAIHRENGKMNCWVCDLDGFKYRPNFVNLVMELENCDFITAKSIIKDYTIDSEDDDVVEHVTPSFLSLPQEMQSFHDTICNEHWSVAYGYLESRGFDMTHVDKYKLGFCSHGEYAYRIIVPIYFEGKLVSFVGRDYTSMLGLRYMNCRSKDVLMKNSDVLYGYDNYISYRMSVDTNHLYLLEGCTDVWSLGDVSVGLLTNKIHSNQVSLLIRLGLKSLTIAMDPGSYSRGINIAEKLCPFIRKIKVLKLIDGDPAEIGLSGVQSIENKTSMFIP